jgi:hypothetical protein
MSPAAPVPIAWSQALGWRLGRQLLSPPAGRDALEVATRLCGVQAQVPSAAELACAVRIAVKPAQDLAAGPSAGRLMRTWTVRGTLHVLPVETAARQLALLAHARTWHSASWQKTFATLPVMQALAEQVHAALADGPLTRTELVAAVSGGARQPDVPSRDFAERLASGWSSLLKPLAWQGVLCQGPPHGRSVTFARPDLLYADWPGLPDPHAAGPAVLRDYLAAYGPATPQAFDAWLARGATRRADLRRWIADLADETTTIDVEGRPALVLTEHLADVLAAPSPDGQVHLLAGFDQYVLGPGTTDHEIVPPAHRARVSRAGGWISPVVLLGGRVAGTWQVVDGEPRVAPFAGVSLPRRALAAAIERTTALLGDVDPDDELRD